MKFNSVGLKFIIIIFIILILMQCIFIFNLINTTQENKKTIDKIINKCVVLEEIIYTNGLWPAGTEWKK